MLTKSPVRLKRAVQEVLIITIVQRLVDIANAPSNDLSSRLMSLQRALNLGHNFIATVGNKPSYIDIMRIEFEYDVIGLVAESMLAAQSWMESLVCGVLKNESTGSEINSLTRVDQLTMIGYTDQWKDNELVSHALEGPLLSILNNCIDDRLRDIEGEKLERKWKNLVRSASTLRPTLLVSTDTITGMIMCQLVLSSESNTDVHIDVRQAIGVSEKALQALYQGRRKWTVSDLMTLCIKYGVSMEDVSKLIAKAETIIARDYLVTYNCFVNNDDGYASLASVADLLMV